MRTRVIVPAVSTVRPTGAGAASAGVAGVPATTAAPSTAFALAGVSRAQRQPGAATATASATRGERPRAVTGRTVPGLGRARPGGRNRGNLAQMGRGRASRRAGLGTTPQSRVVSRNCDKVAEIHGRSGHRGGAGDGRRRVALHH